MYAMAVGLAMLYAIGCVQKQEPHSCSGSAVGV